MTRANKKDNMMTDKPKKALPQHIAEAMGAWRAGFNELPASYIDFHEELAIRAIEELKPSYIIHNTCMVPDGWMDGMRTLVAIAEKRDTGELIKLQWNDGSQSFFKKLPNYGGSVPLSEF